MSNDEEYEVLFSSHDYKKLDAKSKQLEALIQHFTVENK